MSNSSLTAFLALIVAPATNSGLIVFLPLVGAIVGGIVGAWANSWYRNREDKKAQQQKCKGLLLLICHEVLWNNIALHDADDQPTWHHA